MSEKFVLPPGMISNFDVDESWETLKAMHECGIDCPPFDTLTIELPAKEVFKITGLQKEESEGRFEGENLNFIYKELPKHLLHETPEGMAICGFDMNLLGKKKGYRDLPYFHVFAAEDNSDGSMQHVADGLRAMGRDLLGILIVLLANRQVVKERRDFTRLRRLGIGKKREYDYVTTLSLPMQRGPDGDPTGRTVAMHLRRGHVRMQHWGPNNGYVKKVFIEPTWVNADGTFVSLRDRYNVSLKGPG